MQAVKKNRVSLTALDGGLADLAISPIGNIDSTHARGFAALARLVKASGSAVDLSPGTEASGSGKPGLATELPGAPQKQAMNIKRIRAFSPVIRSGFRTLDMVLVSPCQNVDSRPARLVADATSGTAATIDAETVDLACSYARRFERGSVQVVVGVDEDIYRDDSLQQTLASCRERWPGVEIELLTATEAVAALMAGQSRLDVTATTYPLARILAEVAGSLSGAQPLITCATLSDNLITVTAPNEAMASTDGSSFPMSSFVLATAELLVWLGQTEAVNRLLNGWCRALELGLHSPEIRVTHPYSRELDENEFAEGVIEQLGELPQGLNPHCPAPRSDRSLKRFTANLHLVR